MPPPLLDDKGKQAAEKRGVRSHSKGSLAPRIKPQSASRKVDAIPETDFHGYALASGNSLQLVV